MKKENGKILFGVFSEKSFKILAMICVIVASPFILAGCSDGKNGIKILSGLSYTEFTDAKVGDYFIDTDDYILYTKTTKDWEVVMRNFGKPGTNGQDGKDGQDGTNGKDGQTVTVSINSKGYWVINGKTTTTKATGKDGNTPYINNDGYWYIGNTSTGIKAQGEQGLQGNVGKSAFELYKEENPEFNGTLQDWLESLKGQNGEKGQDGTSVYIGYDGYIWIGKTKTKYKLQTDETTKTNVYEDTIEVSNAMKEYFDYEYVDLSSNTIALMQYYKPNAQMTIYGNTFVNEIQIVSEEDGALYIGKAKVSDIVNARTKGTKLKATTTSYNVLAGENTIKFNTPLELAEGETLVLGGSGSTAKLYVAKNIPEDDEVGNFTLINGKINTSIISKTGKYADTLAVMVKANAISKTETAVNANFATEYAAADVTAAVVTEYTPFKYNSSYDSNFSGKTITKIGAYMDENNAARDEKPYMTLYKIKTSTTSNFAENALQEVKVYFPENATEGSLVYADCNIVLGDDETIAFGKSDDTFIWRFKGVNSGGNLMNNDGTIGPKAALAFDIYTKEIIEKDFATHLKEINETESTKALQNALAGKNLSILGDSISTFDGYSNDSTNTNSTIGSNYASYGTSGRDFSLSSVNDTWWMQTANMTGMNVLVNNSYGGSKVTDTSNTSANALTRAQNLHDNTGNNANTNPDIIAVYLGINDFNSGVSSTNFASAYDKMIAQIRTTYGKNVKIFVFTHVTYGIIGDNNATLLAYNTAIKETASKYNCVVVDYANSGVKSSNLSTYMLDSSHLHPNEKGMDIISDCFLEALKKTYVTNSGN